MAPWTGWAKAWQIVATQAIAIRPRPQSRAIGIAMTVLAVHPASVTSNDPSQMFRYAWHDKASARSAFVYCFNAPFDLPHCAENGEHNGAGGSLGVLIGADLLNLGKLQGLGAPVASIGGAGTFDGIFVTGLIAVLLAGLTGRRTAR